MWTAKRFDPFLITWCTLRGRSCSDLMSVFFISTIWIIAREKDNWSPSSIITDMRFEKVIRSF
ncbi:unnamed protein product [Musa acuminata subsp. burmannicoides]